MKAAVFYGPLDVKTEEVEKPGIKDNEILVNVKACGICGSDLHMYKLDLFTDMLCRQLERGGIPGHEFSGDVVEVGSQVQGIEVGLNKIVVVDVSDYRLDVAKQLGADEIINASAVDPYEKVMELVGSAPLLFQPTESTPAVDIIYDCVGYIKERPEPPVIQQALNMVRDFTGRIVVHGIFEEIVSLDLLPMVAKQVDVLGSYGFIPSEVEQALELIRIKKVDRQGLISHEFSLDQAKEGFEAQCKVEESIKVLIKP